MGSSLEKDIQLFQTLSYEDQKNIVTGMLEKLKDTNEQFFHLYQTVDNIWNVSKELLLIIYQELLELSMKKKDSVLQLEIESFHMIKKKLSTIRKSELLEQEDIDQLLLDM